MDWLKNISKTQKIFGSMGIIGLIALVLLISLVGDMRNFYLLTLGALVVFFGVFVLFKLVLKKDTEFKPSKFKIVNKFRNGLITNSQKIVAICRVFAVILGISFVARFMGGYDYLQDVDKLQSDFLNQAEVALALIFNQLYTGTIFLVIVAQFINSKTFSMIVKYIVTPLLIIFTFGMPLILSAVVGDIFNGSSYDPYGFRTILMGLEYGLMIGLVVKEWILHPNFEFPKSFIYTFIITLIILIGTSINSYTFEVLLGDSIIGVKLPLDFNFLHRILIYLAFLMPIFLFVVLFRYDIPHRRAFLTFIALNVLFAYIGVRRFENTWTSVESLPLHLCNTAMYIIPFTLVFKTTKVFYFTMFINVIGAFLALLMPNYDSDLGAFSTRVVEFYINHLYAFFMPILIVLLGVYERPKLKYFGYSMVGFFLYFVVCVVINTIFGTDFFFLGDDFIVSKLGSWAENIYLITVSFEIDGTTYTLNFLYLILFYLIYVVFAFLMWYIYELLFRGVDSVISLRDKELALRKRNKEYIESEESRGMDMKKKIDMSQLKDVEATLEIENLSKKYGKNEFYTIKDFSLKLTGGKIYGFLGKNGAGKSTIIKAIVGMHTFNDGSIKVCGYDNVVDEVEARSLIGFVPDHYALYESLTGRQYINYIADLYNVSKVDREVRLADLLPRLDLETKFDNQIKTYSHGMKQKIAIIAALIHDPKIWILDEPMTGVDPISIYQIKECMKEHARKGNIVFFSSHLIDVVKNLCDEIIIIRHGELVYREEVETLNENNIDLEKLFIEKTLDEEDKALVTEAI